MKAIKKGIILNHYRELLLSFIYSLTFCNCTNEITNLVDKAFQKTGIAIPWYDLDDLRKILQDMNIRPL